MKNTKEEADICEHCGQVVNKLIFWKHIKKKMKKEGFNHFVKLMKIVEKKTKNNF